MVPGVGLVLRQEHEKKWHLLLWGLKIYTCMVIVRLTGRLKLHTQLGYRRLVNQCLMSPNIVLAKSLSIARLVLHR